MVSKRNKVILLIEDEELVADLLRKKLEQAGYLVRIARDGEAGLKLIRELEPDLVILDMLLPKRNGFSVLEALYKEKITPSLPLLVISNSGQPIEIERVLALGARDYLIKVNLEPGEVLHKVERIFARDAAAPPLDEGKESKGTSVAHILLVEDDPFLSELVTRRLTKEGYDVSRATDVKQAHTILDKTQIHLIFLDLVLPGVDGFTFLQELKSDSRFKEIPVVILSNLGQEEEVKRGLEAGASAYLIKAHTTPGEISLQARRSLGIIKH